MKTSGKRIFRKAEEWVLTCLVTFGPQTESVPSQPAGGQCNFAAGGAAALGFHAPQGAAGRTQTPRFSFVSFSCWRSRFPRAFQHLLHGTERWKAPPSPCGTASPQTAESFLLRASLARGLRHTGSGWAGGADERDTLKSSRWV